MNKFTFWNLDKIVALRGELGQVHMTKKYIAGFPPCGKMDVFVTVVIFLLSLKKELDENGFWMKEFQKKALTNYRLK